MKILVGLNPKGVDKFIPQLQEEYPQIEFLSCSDHERLKEIISDVDIYLGWITRELFLKAKKLRWIQSPSSGVDQYLTIPELVNSDVILTSARGTHGACLAESIMGMILSFTRGIRESILAQQHHRWIAKEIRNNLIELTGSVMGIIGFGVVGQALAKRASAFDMKIIALDMYVKEKPDYVDELWGLDKLDDLLRESDFVVITVPKTPMTIDMIGAREISLMKSTAMLVGISRGGIINQTALAQALREKRIYAAALDVFETEPLPEDNELWDLENLIITPHIAGGTQYEAKYIFEIFKKNIRQFMEEKFPLINEVDKQRGF